MSMQILLWGGFSLIILFIMFLDLFVLNSKHSKQSLSKNVKICVGYISVAILFGFFIWFERGKENAFLFWSGYLVEFSLSIDNIFVMSLIFSSLSILPKYHHRVLFWGIIGAIVMRALMIALGAVLVSQFHFVLYIFSVFLLVTGAKILWNKEEEKKDIKQSKFYNFISKKFRVVKNIKSEEFFIKKNNKYYATPLLFALIMIEFMDVIFAIDSIPAIFLITQDTFIVYTSNIFAIMGLRSLYFLLSSAANKFRYLKTALGLILIFIGAKIFAPFLGFEVNQVLSLSVTFILIFGSIGLSILKKA